MYFSGVMISAGYTAKDVGRFLLKTKSFTVGDCRLDGYTETENGIISTTADDKLYLTDLGFYVSNVTVTFSEPMDSDRSLWIYYSVAGEPMSNDRLRICELKKGQTYAEFPLGKEVSILRLDFGDGPGQVFALSSVKLNHIRFWNKNMIYMCLALLALCFLTAFCEEPFFDRGFRYRYAIGAALCFVGILFEFHGSSVGSWQEIYGSSVYANEVTPVFGQVRPVRGDDWALSTSLALSQEYNDYRRMSHLIAPNDRDVFIVYGQPVRDWSVLFRPSHWGYVLFGGAKGLSWFWILRAVGLFLVSWDFGELLTKKRRLGLVYATGILFSPLVQWWFGTNGLVEMLIFGQAALLFLYRLLHCESRFFRCLYWTGICYSGCIYLLVFYPAWQVPLFYVLLAVAIGMVSEFLRKERSEDSHPVKKRILEDALPFAGILAVLGAAVLFIFYRSREAIGMTLNTDYPGKRFDTGGGALSVLAGTPAGMFFSWNTDLTALSTNVCEPAGFYGFFPFGLLLAVLVLIGQYRRKEKKDAWLFALAVMDAFVACYSVFGFPSFLARISFMFFTVASRAVIASQLMEWMILLRCIALYPPKKDKKAYLWALSFPLFALAGTIYGYRGYLTTEMLLLLTAALIALAVCYARGLLKKDPDDLGLGLCFVCVAVFTGLFVNPLDRGLRAFTENELLMTVRDMAKEEPEEIWMFSSPNGYIGNSLVAVGARTVDSLHVYPDMEMWHVIDPKEKDRYIYNRYLVVQTEVYDENELSNPTRDSIHAYVTPEVMRQWGVSRVISTHDLSALEGYAKEFSLLKHIGDYYILKLK